MPLRILTTTIALCLPSLVLANPGPPPTSATDLDQVTVTATRTARTVEQSLAAVEVIDHEQILRSQATSLPDLLHGRAGINLSNQGGIGKLTTVFLRGTESDHVLVLLDGVRIGSSTSGLAAFQDLPLSMIDRIEIVRGPRSSLYGSDAIGGVIQVFTRRDRGASVPRAVLTAGSHGRRTVSAGIGGDAAHGWYGVDVASQHSDGINACEVATPTPFSGGCFISAPQPDRDGYDNRSLSLRGGVAAGAALEVDGNALRVEGHNHYDGDFVDNSRIVQQVIGGNARLHASDSVDLHLVAGRDVDASHDFLGDTQMDFFSSNRDSATLQADVKLVRAQVLTVGVDWLRDSIHSDTPYDRTTRGNRAAFAQYQGRMGAQDLQAALRRDDNDQFGSHTTGSAAWGLDVSQRWRVTASVGTAFKAPTFNELYYPFFGNAALRPESSRTWEAGVAYRRADTHWRLDTYTTHVDDLIAYDGSIFLPNNIDRARLRGAELTVGSRIAGWSIDASASWVDPRSRSGVHEGNILPRRARTSARLDADRALAGWRIGVTGVAEGARFDDLANTRRLGGYATLDLRAEHAVGRAWNLQARLANVFDRAYETSAFYHQPGREVSLTLRYAPGG